MELVKEYVKPELLEMEEGDFAKAAGLCEDLSKELDVDGSDVVGVIKKALELTPNGVEINGDSFEKFEGDDVVWTYGYPEKNRIPLDEIEWVRIEGYGGINEEDYDGAAILYVYLPIKNGMVDKDSVSFDYYPDKYTDDFVDSVGYVDVKSHGV